MINEEYADLKIRCLKAEQALEEALAELDLYKCALEWAGIADYYLELARREKRERLKG